MLWLVGLLGIVLGGRGPVLSQNQRRRAAEEVERYARDFEKANGLKELFIDIMRHDFLNPAAAVQSYSMYLQEGDGDSKTKKMALRITEANAKLIEMIQDAAKLSRLAEADDLVPLAGRDGGSGEAALTAVLRHGKYRQGKFRTCGCCPEISRFSFDDIMVRIFGPSAGRPVCTCTVKVFRL